jgi:hypothetical protein
LAACDDGPDVDEGTIAPEARWRVLVEVLGPIVSRIVSSGRNSYLLPSVIIRERTLFVVGFLETSVHPGIIRWEMPWLSSRIR